MTNYFSSPEGNMIHDQWTPRFVDEVTGDTTFIPSVTKISEESIDIVSIPSSKTIFEKLSSTNSIVTVPPRLLKLSIKTASL